MPLGPSTAPNARQYHPGPVPPSVPVNRGVLVDPQSVARNIQKLLDKKVHEEQKDQQTALSEARNETVYKISSSMRVPREVVAYEVDKLISEHAGGWNPTPARLMAPSKPAGSGTTTVGGQSFTGPGSTSAAAQTARATQPPAPTPPSVARVYRAHAMMGLGLTPGDPTAETQYDHMLSLRGVPAGPSMGGYSGGDRMNQIHALLDSGNNPAAQQALSAFQDPSGQIRRRVQQDQWDAMGGGPPNPYDSGPRQPGPLDAYDQFFGG